MVFDASVAAFPRPGALNNPPSIPPALSPAKPSIAQSLSDGSRRPAKRQRTAQNPLMTPFTSSSPGPSSGGLDFDALDAARRRSSARVMSLWESLAQRYARPIDEDDEIDILTGKIYKDRGVLRAASERGWRIGSFGEAIEVEPIGGASEAETETGTSECDDEGEEAENVGDTEDADEDEDEFGAWSYDWQYSKIPPPRPELSPQDAEDLEEFLAAERAIQEDNARKNGGKSGLEDGEDEVVCLGDSWHDQDGALLGDDSDDEEFSSFAVDDSTIHLSKLEPEEEDDIAPMSSILGALAIGKTPQKNRPTAIPLEDAKDTRATEPNRTHDRPGIKQTPSIVPIYDTPTSALTTSTQTRSEARVEDELIVIESDTDEESDADMVVCPGLPAACLPPPPLRSPVARSSAGVLSLEQPTGSLHDNIQSGPVAQSLDPKTVVPATSLIATGPKPLADAPQQKRTSFSAMMAALQASTITSSHKPGCSDSIPAESFYSTPSTSKTTAKPISKRMRSRETGKTSAEATKPSASTPQNVTKTPLSTLAKPSTNFTSGAPQKSDSKAVSKRTVDPRLASVAPPPGPKCAPYQAARQSSNGTSSKPARRDHATTATNSPISVLAKTPKPTSTTPSATASSSRSTRATSPVKSKKTLVMEVVLTPCRRTPKTIPQLAKPSTPSPSVNTISANAPALHSGPPSEITGAYDAKSTAEVSSTAQVKPSVRSDTTIRSSMEPQVNRTRKRGRESGERLMAEDAKMEQDKPADLELLEQSQALNRAQSCYSPMLLGSGQNQLPSCCSIPSGCFPSLQPTHGCQHSYPQGGCTHSHTHHCSGVHQHQHQHLHTHVPFPLPQHMHQFTADQFTEAALKLMYGLGAMRSGDSGALGHGIWLPSGSLGLAAKQQEQAESSAQSSLPKLEQKPSSQELVCNSQERVPSSQEDERLKEEELLQRQAQRQPTPTKPMHNHAAVEPLLHPTLLTPPEDVGDSSACANYSPPKLPLPKRESSVIDIDSDSDDELAGFNAGQGSMRWEPAVKDESDSEDGGLYLDDSDDDSMSLSTPEGKAKRYLRRRRNRGKRRPTSSPQSHRAH
ncbi:centromere protein Scm3 [Ceratobasidium sp. AG-Ba]|nr:centromere protein Scm3 [Ceratobasidium sp. AG-Ba]QRW14556.1 centromere protein Scm3 [Ceratobasidium sp. AG-Ba]